MREYLIEVLSEITDRPVTVEDSISVLGTDSLDLLNSFTEVERRISLEIPDPVMVQFKTINDLVSWVELNGNPSDMSGAVEHI